MKQTKIENGICTIYKQCSVENKVYEVKVDADKYHQYLTSKELIQNIFPGLTVDEREFIISGWTPKEWDEMFKDIEE